MNIDVYPDCFLAHGPNRWRCALGRGGVGVKHTEGDGITPTGTYGLGRVWWRNDRLEPPHTKLQTFEITENMGWCDDPDHQDYNHFITFPHGGSCEHMWRTDGAYDIVVEVLFNTKPVIKGRGSAIFLHSAAPDYRPTQGCIALKTQHLLDLLRVINTSSRLIIHPLAKDGCTDPHVRSA